jgi:hypothetical protein
MEQLIWVSLFIFLLIFLNKKMIHIEGYTNCNKQPALQLFSVHFNQQFGELSILNNLDLANRAHRANIPLKTIKQLIHKDKYKLISMIMIKEKSLMDMKEQLSKQIKTKKEKHPPHYVPREITGYNFS